MMDQQKSDTGCSGCRFTPGRSERCKTCSRRYADRFEAPPPPKKTTKASLQALTLIAALAHVMGNPDGRY
jgi:hypothetical protein